MGFTDLPAGHNHALPRNQLHTPTHAASHAPRSRRPPHISKHSSLISWLSNRPSTAYTPCAVWVCPACHGNLRTARLGRIGRRAPFSVAPEKMVTCTARAPSASFQHRTRTDLARTDLASSRRIHAGRVLLGHDYATWPWRLCRLPRESLVSLYHPPPPPPRGAGSVLHHTPPAPTHTDCRFASLHASHGAREHQVSKATRAPEHTCMNREHARGSTSSSRPHDVRDSSGQVKSPPLLT